MSIKGLQSHYNENTKLMHYLSEEQCEQILNAAFTIMETTGFRIDDKEVSDLFVANGATLSEEDGTLKIPRELIIKYVNMAGNRSVVYDRNGNVAMDLCGVKKSYFGLGPTNPYTNDFETGERRNSLRADVARAAQVADACPNIDYLMGLSQISDENVAISDVYEGYEMMTNSTKPMILWGINKAGLDDQVHMADIIAGGHDKLVEKPFIILFPGCPDTPLQINSREAQNIMYCAKSGLPMIWMGGGQLGTVTPVVLPASAAISTAEMLVGIVIAQMANPGCTVITGFGILTVDMKSMASLYGTPEHCIGEMMSSDIFHYLDIPCIQTAGVTDSKIVDAQSAIETSMNVLSTILTGCNLVHDVGFMDSALSGSVEQIVLSDEVIGYARRIVEPMIIDEETLALDLIDEVGPGGSYITEEHTMENFRDQVWYPSLIDHSPYKEWVKDEKSFSDRVHDKTAKILAEHKAAKLPDEVMDLLQVVLDAAEARTKA